MRTKPALLLKIFLFTCWLCSSGFSDNVPPSKDPPGGLLPEQVPMFVSIGFDDNGYAGLENSGNKGGMKWAYDLFHDRVNPAGTGNPATYDGTPVRISFFVTSCYFSSNPADEKSVYNLQWILNAVYKDGHEMGNHTWLHTTRPDSLY